MASEIKIPVPDQTTEEVRIVKWCKAPGDSVVKGEIILEVETDKSVMEVEAIAEGVLFKQLFEVDDMVSVSEVVGYIGEEGAEVDVVEPTGSLKPAVSVSPPADSVAPSVGVKASPVALNVAVGVGVDINQVAGSGPDGKVMRGDVESFNGMSAVGGRLLASPNSRRLARALGVDVRQLTGSGPNGRILSSDVKSYAASAPTRSMTTDSPVGSGQVVELSKMRRAIGRNLQYSSRETPHFNVTMSIDMTRAMQTRTWLNQGKQKSQKVSVNDLVIKACAGALKQFPAVNSRFSEEAITYLPEINIGVAIALTSGLVVPVLTDADSRDWRELAMETRRLAGEARNGKIIGAGKGTFTVSNLGMFGVDNFTAIINPPESAILAVGAVKDEVTAVDGMITIKPMMKVTLCSDHRVIDGSTAAQFLKTVKNYLEERIA